MLVLPLQCPPPPRVCALAPVLVGSPFRQRCCPCPFPLSVLVVPRWFLAPDDVIPPVPLFLWVCFLHPAPFLASLPRAFPLPSTFLVPWW